MNPAPAPQPAADKHPAALSLPDQRKEARDQLNLVLSFFSRVDAKASALIYFWEVARRTETNFIDAFRAEEEESRVKDLLGQVWRNSSILSAKFDALKWAFILMALAIIPWSVTVALFSSQTASVQTVITK